MKSYYLLIVADSVIDNKTKFYRVAIGQSALDQKAFQALSMWANAHGHYFQKYCSEVDRFVFRIACSLGKKVYDLPKMTLQVSDLMKSIRDFGRTPEIPPLSKTAAFARQIIDPAAYFQQQLNVIRRAEASRRNKPKVL